MDGFQKGEDGWVCQGWRWWLVCMSGDAGALPQCDALMKRMITPPSTCAGLGRVEQGLVGLPGMALAPDATRRPRFDVLAADWLLSVLLQGAPVVAKMVDALIFICCSRLAVPAFS